MRFRSSTPARAGEAGSALIEVLVSAFVLLIAIVALFLTLDVQTDASGTARASSAAAGLAEADQERLRSFRVPQLSNRREVRTVSVAGVPYSVDSDVEWIRDATGGTQSCASSSTQADYLRLTTTVTGRTGGQSPPAPIRLRSLVAAPVGQFGEDQGTVVVSVAGGAGQPIQGATVTITGPTTLSDVTNELGCAVFGYVPVGSYTVQVSATGFVDPAGNAVASGSATATEGTVNLTSLQYDRSGSVNVSFDTKVGSVVQAASSASLSAANAGVPANGSAPAGIRLFRPSGPQSAIAATSLHPFATDYTFYSGSCAAANPATYDANYFAANPGSVSIDPGSTAAVTVREPALQLTVKTAAVSTAVNVRAKAIDAGCTDVFNWQVVTDASKSAKLPEPGLPFGMYRVCAEAGGQSKTIASVALTSPAGSSAQTIDLTTGTVAAACAP